jgi:predicted ribosomally synthesized peptide with SipW-like signal peptide
MRQALLSILAVALVAGLAGGGLMAYFSDTEISEDNQFSVSNVDLAVDVNWYDQGQEHNPWPEHVPLIDPATTADIKPEHGGEATISLHVYCYEADLYMFLDTLTHSENGRIDPEMKAGDATENVGELIDFLYLELWQDNGVDGVAATGDPGEGDNIKQPEEDFIWLGYAAELLDMASMEEPHDCLLIAGPIRLLHCKVYYMGCRWHFDRNNGTGADVNTAQGDSFGTDIVFRVVNAGDPAPPCP